VSCEWGQIVVIHRCTIKTKGHWKDEQDFQSRSSVLFGELQDVEDKSRLAS